MEGWVLSGVLLSAIIFAAWKIERLLAPNRPTSERRLVGALAGGLGGFLGSYLVLQTRNQDAILGLPWLGGIMVVVAAVAFSISLSRWFCSFFYDGSGPRGQSRNPHRTYQGCWSKAS